MAPEEVKPPAWRSYDDDDGGGSDDGGSGSSPSTVNGGVTYELRYFKTEEQAREGVKQCGVIEMNSIRNVTGGKADDETSISLHACEFVDISCERLSATCRAAESVV